MVDVADCADVDVWLLPLEFSTSCSDSEGAEMGFAAAGGGRGSCSGVPEYARGVCER